MEDLPSNLPPGHLADRIHAKWLTIHSKKLEGTDTDLCLREAYDVCASELLNSGYKLDDLVLTEVIPSWVVHFAAAKAWLPADPPDHWHEDLMECLSDRIGFWQVESRLGARIRAGWLPIRSKKLEGADTDLCLREAYDVCASEILVCGYKLGESVLREVIPSLVLRFAAAENWLSAVPPEQRCENVMKCLSGRMAYWQSVEEARSPLHERWEALKELGQLMDGPHEKIPEEVVRITIAQKYGIKSEEVSWDDISYEVSRLILRGDYRAIEVVPTNPATDENRGYLHAGFPPV